MEVVLRKAQVNMKHLLPTLVVILLIIQSGKSMFLVSVQSKGIARRCRALYDYE